MPVPINSQLYKQLASMRTLLRRDGEFREAGLEPLDEPGAVIEEVHPASPFPSTRPCARLARQSRQARRG